MIRRPGFSQAAAAIAMIVFLAPVEPWLYAQPSSRSDLVARLAAGTPHEIATAIETLSGELLNQDDVVGQLVSLLDDERPIMEQIMGRETVRGRAWFKLLELESRSVPSIARRLPELKSDQALGLALEAIARVGDHDDATYLEILPYCRRDDAYVRSRAIAALSKVGEDRDRTIAHLAEMLSDPHPMVRWTILDSLEERKEAIIELLPAITNLLDDDSDVHMAISDHAARPEKLRGRAARLLGAVGSRAADALPKLKNLTNSQFDINVRVWAVSAVCSISEEPPPDALDLLGQLLLSEMDNEHADHDAPRAIQALGPRAAPLLGDLERAKQHRSPAIRWGVAEAFFAVDPGSAVTRVLPMMDDEDELVVETVITALSDQGLSDSAIIDAYIRALDHPVGLFDQPAHSAVDALAKLGPAARKALPALKRLIDAPEISDTLRDHVGRAMEAIE